MFSLTQQVGMTAAAARQAIGTPTSPLGWGAAVGLQLGGGPAAGRRTCQPEVSASFAEYMHCSGTQQLHWLLKRNSLSWAVHAPLVPEQCAWGLPGNKHNCRSMQACRSLLYPACDFLPSDSCLACANFSLPVRCCFSARSYICDALVRYRLHSGAA